MLFVKSVLDRVGKVGAEWLRNRRPDIDGMGGRWLIRQQDIAIRYSPMGFQVTLPKNIGAKRRYEIIFYGFNHWQFTPLRKAFFSYWKTGFVLFGMLICWNIKT